jgi:hypothetical protein
MNDLYIYYKVRDQHADELELHLRMMQAELGLATGVYGDIKRRTVSRDGLQTWMECYLGTGDGFAALLAAAVQDAPLAGLIEGDRHTEVFTELSPCA